MAALGLSLNLVEPFDTTGDHSSVSQRWTSWKTSFEFYLGASGVNDKKQQRCLLLHCAGNQVQEIFATLPDTGEDYAPAMTKLTEHFSQHKNVPFQRHVFRKCVPEEGETVRKFVTRLQRLAANCDFGASKNDFIRDQVIDTCKSRALRVKLLSETELTLEKLITLATAREGAEYEANLIENKKSSEATEVNWVQQPSRQASPMAGWPQCDRCGK